MKQKDQAILIRKTNYSETSLILTLFCREKGIKKFIFQGGKKKHGNILFPLAVLETEYYARNDSELGKVTSVTPEFIYTSIHTHPYKSATVFFIAEILQKVLNQENEKEEAFFLFLVAEIYELDVAPFEANFPLWFIIELTKWLGIEPQCDSPNSRYFNKKDGHISTILETNSSLVESGNHIEIVSKIIHLTKDQALGLTLSSRERNKSLRVMLDYYAMHIHGFSFPKSLEVLEEVLHG